MKRLSYLCLFLFLCVFSLQAADLYEPKKPYSLHVSAEYAYNRTYTHFANINLQAHMPINPHFDLGANIQLSSANVYTAGLAVRPHFPLPVGDIFLQSDLLYKAYVRNRSNDFCAAMSIGYRMDYALFRVGMFSRVFNDWTTDYHSAAAYVCEPFNLLYELQVGCRPADSPWNLWLTISNIDEYQMERMWQPFARIGARYDLDAHWRMLIEAEGKLSGMFHLNASLYAASLRAGFVYRF